LDGEGGRTFAEIVRWLERAERRREGPAACSSPPIKIIAHGLDSVWMFDHFFNRPDGGSIEGMYESWTILSALASVTERITLGTLVMCGTFRNPGLLAKMAATLDEVSGGRLILGVGTGWHDPEHEAFGFPLDHRYTRFEEMVEIVRRLLDGERVTHSGRFHRMRGAVLAPPPARRVPQLIAGHGPRMLRLAARSADAWNGSWFGGPGGALTTALGAFDAALQAEGRDPTSIERTIGLTIRDPAMPLDEDDEPAFRGSIQEMTEMFDGYARLGIDHLILEIGPKTSASLARVAEAVTRYRG
jgi:alkanesulfonate monooxygenase SsuD/methylene tetrahydromethanopterin reductase-like flavin-dependent oxidoreductase (luciferase family)